MFTHTYLTPNPNTDPNPNPKYNPNPSLILISKPNYGPKTIIVCRVQTEFCHCLYLNMHVHVLSACILDLVFKSNISYSYVNLSCFQNTAVSN